MKNEIALSRRGFLGRTAIGMGALSAGSLITACNTEQATGSAQITDSTSTEQAFPLRPVSARIVAELLSFTFLENLEIDSAGKIYVTSVFDGRVWATSDTGALKPFARMEGRAHSIASTPDGDWLVFGTTLDGTVCIVEVSASGQVEELATVPQSFFPNGVQRFPDGHYLWADSVTGSIWDFDYSSRSTTLWYEHPMLGVGESGEPPALNGMKYFDGKLYVSNTAQTSLLEISLSGGRPVGAPRLVRDDLNMDDFAFGVDGSIFFTTHPQDRVGRIDAAGDISWIAGIEEGVQGCTACRFGRAPGDETGLYVTTDGGLFNPGTTGFTSGKLVRLETGVTGAPVDFH